MPRLMLGRPEGHGVPGPGVRAALDRALRRRWGEGGAAAEMITCEREPIPADFAQEAAYTLDDSDLQKAPHSPPSQRRSRLLPFSSCKKAWCTFLPAAVVWSVCHLEAALSLVDVCWSLSLLCSLWAALGGCVYLLMCYLRSSYPPGGTAPRLQEEVVTKSEVLFERSRSPDKHIALGLILADSLLLSVLQEPSPDPSGPNMLDLLSRLEAVSNTLDPADLVLDVPTQSQVLTDKVTLIRTYLQQRTTSLRTLVQVQADFEAGVKELQEEVELRWAQLEDLHTGVTLTKEGGQDHRDLASTLKDAETLFAVLSRHRSQLDDCQELLKDSTHLLQELTWSHSRALPCLGSNSRTSESLWPEVLLQSNMEQFDKGQERFLSLEQQTSTFQAHLEGLVADRASSSPSLDLNSGLSSNVSSDHWESTTTADSDSEVDADSDTDAQPSLCERSAFKVTSTIGHLRKSSRKKK
uniref:uncharacterized protein si:ch211-151h10.2 n=1 Tax=Doryrhamphus excisus TaxID=161450 RepID=UPI0025AE2077|nr:uncharacterized protein si:ch211-151h10.2 [Doryrhamphus excisus]